MTCMNFESMLHEGNHRGPHAYTIPFEWKCPKRQIYRVQKLINICLDARQDRLKANSKSDLCSHTGSLLEWDWWRLYRQKRRKTELSRSRTVLLIRITKGPQSLWRSGKCTVALGAWLGRAYQGGSRRSVDHYLALVLPLQFRMETVCAGYLWA